jgi:hypothetical protein
MGDAAHMAMGMALIAPIAGASATATAAFFASDPDDSVVVLLLFSGAEEPRGCWPVVAGRYLGFSLLVLAGLLGIGGLLQLQSGSFDDRPAAVLAAGTPRPGDLLHPMHGPPMASLFQRLRAVLLALARGALNPGWAPPVAAATVPGPATPAGADLQAAIAASRDPQRQADLLELADAVAMSDQRARISNASSHRVGVFARCTKDPAGTPASDHVPAPGHATDDDHELVAQLAALTQPELDQASRTAPLD